MLAAKGLKERELYFGIDGFVDFVVESIDLVVSVVGYICNVACELFYTVLDSAKIVDIRFNIILEHNLLKGGG